MKKFLSISVFVGLCITLWAQTPAEQIINRMNHVFQHVDRGKVVTGLLSDYGIPPIPLEYYDGVPADSNFVDMDSYMLLYAGLYSSKFNDNITLITPNELSTRIQNYASGSAIPVSIMHYAYNRIKETAVEEGLVSVVNDQIIEIPGKNPYETADLFAAGPNDVVFEGAEVSFMFPSSLRLTNIAKTVASLQVRFDDNSAYRTTGWDTAISHTYTAEGIKKIRFKINYTDGTSFISQTNIWVKIPQMSGITRGTGPGEVNNVPIESSATHSGGTVQIRYATSNSTGKIKKALVIAEGFDPYPLLNLSNTNLDSLLNNPRRTNYIIPEIDINEYDIVYVDNNNGIEDIRRNAALFTEALELANSPAYRHADAASNVVMGISMGGLVARYALRKMEMEGKDHKTWKYISMDSPHKGANVPVGLQAALRHLASFDLRFAWFTIYKMTNIPLVGDALEILNSIAAKQMLIYNVNDDGTGFDNSVHNAFLAEYEQMGFPQKCQNIAVSNGNANGTQLFSLGSQLFDIDYRIGPDAYYEYMNVFFNLHPFSLPFLAIIYASSNPKLFLNVIPGRTSFGVYADIYGIGATANSIVYSGSLKLHKKILWLINSSVTLTSSTLRTQQGMVPIDGIAGGIIDLESYLEDAPEDFQSFVKQTKFCFIPRGSALALNDWNTNFSTNILNQDLFGLNKTNFEHTAMPLIFPEFHVTFDEVKQFVINQLKDKPISPHTFPTAFCGDRNVTLNNSQNVPLTWSVSDNMFGILSPTNTSATIRSAPTARSAVLSIASTNNFPLRRRLFSTCNLSISGPSTLLGEATYSIADLPADATVQWSTSNTNITLVFQGGDSALFRSDYYGDCTITANIAAGGSSVSLSRPVFADIDLSHLNNTYVNASDFACGQASFTMMNLPSGSFVKWSCGIGTTHTPDTDATYSFYTSGYPPSHPGVDKMMTQITYKGKTQEWEDEFNFNFDRPYLSYQVGDSILEIDYGYINNGSAWITVQYNYPFNGISGEWSSLTPGWILMPGYTGEYAAFEGSADISFITVQLCFDTPCGSRACYTRDFIPPQYLYGNSPDGFIVYPNPATHTVTVDLSDIKTNADSRAVALKDYRIQLWSASGLLRELRTERQTCQLSLSGIPAGLYFVHVIKDGKKYRKKLIVR